MALSADEVRHVAKLAQLALSEEEVARLGAQLSAILDAVAQLSLVDTTGVEPTYQTHLTAAPWREDLVRPPLGAEAALAAAPASVGDGFAVPRVIDPS